ncbi:MAG: hypothetical protein EPN85_14655 [Bacteroidetes bacterium]|nr:MAG: hypothetical protein EPN85_14655 [Bacteroidota bacterium]
MVNQKIAAFLSKTQYCILLLLLFLMPFSRQAIPPLIIAWIIVWSFNGNLRENILAVFKSKIGILPVLFYFLHVIGMFYTSNQPEGRFDLEVKLSLFLFPLLMFGSASFIKEKLHSFLWCFVISNFVSSLISFVVVIPKISSQYYLYNDFTMFLHPTYGAMYVLFSISILVYFLFENKIPAWKNNISASLMKWLMLSLIAFFSVIVFLYSSRAGLITGIAILFVSAAFFLYRKKINLFIKILTIIGILSIIVFIVNQNRRFVIFSKFLQSNSEVNYQVNENVSVRYMVVVETINLIQENFWTGVGTGDVKDVLVERYKLKGFKEAEKQNMNPHNQFLETTLGLGIISGLLLLVLTMMPLAAGIKHGNILLIFFSIIIIVNFTFECMFDTQAGVIFFAIFYSLLSSVKATPKINY